MQEEPVIAHRRHHETPWPQTRALPRPTAKRPPGERQYKLGMEVAAEITAEACEIAVESERMPQNTHSGFGRKFVPFVGPHFGVSLSRKDLGEEGVNAYRFPLPDFGAVEPISKTIAVKSQFYPM